MKKNSDRPGVMPTILNIVVFCLLALPALGYEFDEIGTLKTPNEAKWGGLLWKDAELKSFSGRPQTGTDADTNLYVTVAYDRYVSYYDIKGHAPRWVAYVTDRASAQVTDEKSRTGIDFKRPSQFFTDGVIAEASKAAKVLPAEHDDYKDRVPEGLDVADAVPEYLTAKKAAAYPAYIERGHMAANNTMKTWGSRAQGQKAQLESFSLANIVPQMSAHNAPTWSALEGQCLAWAKELGTVAVVVGPIYNHPAQPRHILERKTGALGDVTIPFPDALFCVVIGKRGGKTSAIGFIMPQATATYSFKEKVVPIDQIEQATGINFMPQMGEPNAIEAAVDTRWINN